MCQGLARQVSVDKGSGGADLVEAQPAKDELGLVGHEERHNVAALDALGQEPIGEFVGR